MKQYTTHIIMAVVAIALLAGLTFLAKSNNAIVEESTEPVALAEKVKGNAEATVVLREHSDFQCPACKSFVPIIEDILADYGDDIRFEYAHFPLVTIHRNAELAARATEAAGAQGQFWEMHDLLFDRQTEWSNNINPRNQFVGYARELGLGVDQFTTHLNAKDVREAVQSEIAQGRELGITGTPTFFLNDERMEFNTFAEFREAIERAIGILPPESASGEVEFGF